MTRDTTTITVKTTAIIASKPVWLAGSSTWTSKISKSELFDWSYTVTANFVFPALSKVIFKLGPTKSGSFVVSPSLFESLERSKSQVNRKSSGSSNSSAAFEFYFLAFFPLVISEISVVTRIGRVESYTAIDVFVTPILPEGRLQSK